MNRDEQILRLKRLNVPAVCVDAVERADLSVADALIVRDLVELNGAPKDGLAALLACLLLTLRDGSLSLRMDTPTLRDALLEFMDDEVDEVASSIMTAFGRGDYDGVIAHDADTFAPVISQTITGDQRLFFQKWLSAARRLRQELRRLLDVDSKLPDDLESFPRDALTDALDDHPVRINGAPLKCDATQQIALSMCLLRDFVVISGGPGSGKTSIIINLLRCLTRQGIAPDEIRLAAPTGLAAQRVQDSLRMALSSVETPSESDRSLVAIDCSTIHRLLGYSMRRNTFTRDAHNPLVARALIVDEVSMVDVELMADLLEAIADGTKVILLGDRDQLPSVEAGAVLADLTRDETGGALSEEMSDSVKRIRNVTAPIADHVGPLTDHYIRLDATYRSCAEILEIAEAVSSGAEAIVDWLPLDSGHADSGVGLLSTEPDRESRLRSIVDDWTRRHYIEPNDNALSYARLLRDASCDDERSANIAALFDHVGRARVLTLLREGPDGAANVNRMIEARLRSEWRADSRERAFPGQIVMIARNDYSRGLFNGQVGIVIGKQTEGLRAVFRHEESFISRAINDLPPFDSAFAITVHKSQGSEYDNVLLVLPEDEGHRLLRREIIYTAMTRARRRVDIFGTADALKQAIARETQRDSGFDFLRKSNSRL